MRRKFLSVVLCVCMMLTMAPFAFAAKESDTSTTNTQEQAPVANSSSGGSGGSTTSVSLPNNNTGNLTISKDNAVLDGSGHTYTNGTITVTAANVTIQNLTFGDKAALVVNTTGKFTLTGCTFTPTTAYTKGSNNQTLTSVRTAVTLNVGEAVVTNNTFDGVTGGYYNAIEFGIGPNQNNLSKATISGNAFNKAIKNNYFNFYNMTADAVIDITGNHFLLAKKGSNAIRISNFRNVSGVTFNVNNNEYTYANDSDESKYEGFILLEDYSPKGDTVQDFSGITININNLTSPSNAKQLFYVYDDQDGIIARNQPIVKGDSSISKFCSARIGDTYYKTLEAALEAASTGNTVALLKDAHVASSISIAKAVTIDLQGKDISLSEASTADLFTLASGANLTIKSTGDANGTISVPTTTYNAVVNVGNNSTFTLESGKVIGDYTVFAGKVTGATINVNGGSIEGNYGITAYGTGTLNDVIINVTGGEIKSTSQAAISTNGGCDKGGVNLTVTGGRIISEDGLGIYLPGINGKTTVTNGTITGKTAIELRAGDLIVSGGSITGTGHPVSVNPNGSGSTTDGVGISVAQHTTKRNTKLTISGGTISGFSAIYESNPQNNGAEDLAKVTLNITGGNFAAINGGTLSVYSEDKTGFISGGYFTTDPTTYVASGYAAKSSNKPNYAYMVATKESEEVIVKPAVATPKVELGNQIANEKRDVVTASAQSVKAPEIANAAAKNVSISSSQAKQYVDTANLTPSSGEEVILYVQSFLDVTPTAYNEEDCTYTLDITPKYQIVASTATTADQINLGANAAGINAVVVKEATVLNVTEPTLVSLNLPADFVSKLTTGGVTSKVYVKHVKDNGKTYIYEATLNDNTLTFINPHGFSEFTITTTAPVATVDGIGYKSLQDAVDAAANGATIVLNSGASHTLNLNTTKSVTVENKTGDKATITFNGTQKEIDNSSKETFSYTRPSSGSGSTSTTYDVKVNAATNGAVAADKKTASKGTTVTVTASPSKGYVVDAVKVVDKDGKDVAVTEKDGKYVFTMPASAVTVTGSFKAETPAPAALPFTDVKSGNWFYDAVKYAYAQGLMTGTSATTFAPNGTMNRAMIVTVLYRLEKSPAVTGASKFTDVPAGQWYSDAVAWAAANKIVNGYDETTFGPMNAVTREQMAAILFRYEQVKGLENVTLEENLNRFPDQNKISAYAIPALQWAVGQKIINGNADGTLDPTGTATRAQVAQIFTNLLNK